MDAEPAAGTPIDTERRFVLLYAGCLLAFGVSVFALMVGNALIWHADGVLDGWAVFALVSVLLGVALVVRTTRRWRGRPRPAWRVGVRTVLLGVPGLLLVGYGAFAVGTSLLFDMTFYTDGHIGASLSGVGIMLGMVMLVPLGCLLLALAPRPPHGPTGCALDAGDAPA